eukprot:2685526-Amphidinium_carterae.1
MYLTRQTNVFSFRGGVWADASLLTCGSWGRGAGSLGFARDQKLYHRHSPKDWQSSQNDTNRKKS